MSRLGDGNDPGEEGNRGRKDGDDESPGYNFFLVMFLDKISFFEKENDGILSELTDLVELRKSMGFSSSEMHALGKNFIVAGGEDSRFRELDVIIKCQTREILRQFPALRDKSILLEAISEAMITNMKIVTVEWFDQFKKSKLIQNRGQRTEKIEFGNISSDTKKSFSMYSDSCIFIYLQP